MEAPKCRLCGKNHPLGADHVFDKSVPQARTGEAVLGPRTPAKGGATPPPAGAARFDRRAYQKAYMRSYRRRQALVVQTAKAVLEGSADRWPRV